MRIPKRFTEHTAKVNGVHLHHYLGGKGSAVILLHGFAQTSRMWFPIMGKLAQRHTVLVPDLRGAGGSAKPEGGYDKKTMAQDIRALASSLGLEHATIVGHDIGLMVTYAYAAQYPNNTDRVVLMDAFLPGIGNWKDVWLCGTCGISTSTERRRWRSSPAGERTYLEHFWNDFAANPKRSVSEADRRAYARAFAQPGGIRAGFEYFKNFERDAEEFRELGKTKLTMPMLVLGGEKSGGNFLIEQAKLIATDVRGVIVAGSGHWLIDEASKQVIPALVDFIN